MKPNKRYNDRLLEVVKCKDSIIDEFRNIRHEYNNLLQKIVCLIEEGNWEGLRQNELEIIRKAQVLNENNMTGLARIKSMSILVLLYDLLIHAGNEGLDFKLNVYNEIEDSPFFGKEICKALETFFQKACFQSSGKDCSIALDISGHPDGCRFTFRRTGSDSKGKAGQPFDIKIPSGVRRFVYLNTRTKADSFEMEFLISFKPC